MEIVSPWYYLGYIIPHLYTDMDAYQFYRIAPEGMVLVTTQLNLHDRTLAGGGGRTADPAGSDRSARKAGAG